MGHHDDVRASPCRYRRCGFCASLPRIANHLINLAVAVMRVTCRRAWKRAGTRRRASPHRHDRAYSYTRLLSSASRIARMSCPLYVGRRATAARTLA